MKTITKERELQSCDTVKTIMMLAVVFCHCVATYTQKGWFIITPVEKPFILGFLSDFTGHYHVQTFVFVSGYLFYYLKYELGKYGNAAEYIKKKSARLLLPYIFALLWVAPVYIFFYKPTPVEILRKLVLGESPSQLWFLLVLFWVSVVFYFVSELLKKFNIVKELTVIKAIIICVFLYLVNLASPVLTKLGVPNVFQLVASFQYFLFFFAGFAFRKFSFRKIYKAPWLIMIASVAITAVFQLFADGLVKTVLWQPICLFNCVSVFVFITGYCSFKGKIYAIFKKYSFQIYLMHQQLIYITLYLFNRNGTSNPYITSALCFAVSILISLMFTSFLSKFKATRLLLGIK